MFEMELEPILHGFINFLPYSKHLAGIVRKRFRQRAGEESYWNRAVSARYCYGLWLKHATLLHQAGMPFPDSVAEIGPGDSLGLGVTALLSGVRNYHAYDAERFARPAHDAGWVDDIAAMLRHREPRPVKGWPDFDACLDAGLFPSGVLTPALLEDALTDTRIEEIRQSLAAVSPGSAGRIRYCAPWDPSSVPRREYDLIVSHSVLEYLKDPRDQFRAFATMLKPGGWMSHQIDLSSLGITRRWNGHLAYSDRLWKIASERLSHRPNRLLPQDYLDALRDTGFELVWSDRACRHDGLRRDHLATRFGQAADDEVNCAALFLIARMPA